MIRVGLVGAIGYGGRELIRLLNLHPEAKLVAAAEVEAGKSIQELLPAFGKLVDVVCEKFDPAALAKKCDVVFIAVPGTKSMALGAALREAGVRTVDMGPDFRIKDLRLYSEYYKVEHTAGQWVREAVYGLVPYYRDQLRDAQLVAAPGCYPASVILPMRPLVDAPIDKDVPIVVDAISGLSGAGRAVAEAFHFPEMNENVKAYRIGNHQHTPEIEQELLKAFTVQFTPHVGAYTRGILSTITVHLKEIFDVAACYERYADEPFVRVLGEGKPAEIRYVRGSNFCDIGWVVDKRTKNLIIVSAIDNLVGGTAGMAVQCMNVMFGLPETTGLKLAGMMP
ncbi:MAG TPA: N-acetyl-gamma-glutamyl-phosphate reductase [Candidatus Hydrogenedentes bacterium]|nr:N-acetyl-gamma-glutamyl-phosphate reductase [Candidatus Hydrogenedentota bacterium]HOV74730.1 N-acetyl-gamma-glutamyl-phosphate reductase [Candidatus Hydrogenedentota bacterium]